MARKPKQGIDYFPLDVGFLQDPKIKRLRQKRGCVGVTIYLDTLAHMYGGKGYFVAYDEDLVYELMDDTSGRYAPNEDVVRAVIEDCISLGLLSRVGNSKMITAHRVQVQFYLTTKRRRDIQVDRGIWMLSEEEMEQLGADSPIYNFIIFASKNGVYANKNGVNAGNNPQSDSESDSNTHTLPAPARADAGETTEETPPTSEEVRTYFLTRGVDRDIEVVEFIAFNAKRGWDCLPNWQRMADKWVSKVPQERAAYEKRAKAEKKTTASFDVDEFFAAAMERSYRGEK